MIKGYSTNKVAYFILSLFFLTYAIYSKEIIFIIPLTIATTNLLFSYKNLNKKQKIFNYLLLLDVVIFLLLYYFIVYINKMGIYPNVSLFNIDNILSVLSSEYYLILIFALSLYGFYRIVVKKDRNNLIYDGILFSATTYSLSVFILGFRFTFYHIVSLTLFLIWFYSVSLKNKLYLGIIPILFLFIIEGINKSIIDYNTVNDLRKTVRKTNNILENNDFVFLVENNDDNNNLLMDSCWEATKYCWHYLVIDNYLYYKNIGKNWGYANGYLVKKLIDDNIVKYIYVSDSCYADNVCYNNFSKIKNNVRKTDLQYWSASLYEVIR